MIRSTTSFRPFVALRALTLALIVLAVSSLRAAEVEFSSYFGGTAADSVEALAVAPDGSVVVVGTSSSPDLYGVATRNGCDAQGVCDNSDVFVLKLSPDGRQVRSGRFLGGSSHEQGRGVAIGSDGSIYVTGVTRSGDFPTVNATQDELGDGATNPSQEDPPRDAFIVKLAPDATTIVYSTYLGGAGNDEAFDIAVDPLGRAMIVGETDGDFAVTEFGFDFSFNGDTDGFVALLHQNGAQISGFYLGGRDADAAHAIAADDEGFFYVAGDSEGGFPTTEGTYREDFVGRRDGWIAKIDPTKIGRNLVAFATYVGGTGFDRLFDLTLDQHGNIYVTGETASQDLPTTEAAYQESCDCGSSGSYRPDAWAAKLSPNGRSLLYATYLGGSELDAGRGIAVDSLGRAFVTGYARVGFPTEPEGQPEVNDDDEGDGFLAVLSPTGRSLASSRGIGGAEGGFFIAGPRDWGSGLAVDDHDNVYAAGTTWSSSFPTTPGTIGEERSDLGTFGTFDGWLAKLGPDSVHSLAQALFRELVTAPLLGPNDVRVLAREIEVAINAAKRGDFDGARQSFDQFVGMVGSLAGGQILSQDTADAWVRLANELAARMGEFAEPQIAFIRGDCDGDGFVGGAVSDIVSLLNWAFSSGPEPTCLAACDVDGDGHVGGTVNDAVYYANWAFLGSEPPRAPFPACGAPNTSDELLGCASSTASCSSGS